MKKPGGLARPIAARKSKLDVLGIRLPSGPTNFNHSQDLKLTYSSNVIKLTKLTAGETITVVE